MTSKPREIEDAASIERYPQWLENLLDWNKRYDGSEAMELAGVIALENVRRGGGPFGTVIIDGSGLLCAAGSNRVVPAADSTAHAEILAIRRAELRLGSHDLSQAAGGPFSLYSTAAPCIMCFGAIWWSGLSAVYAAASQETIEALGFEEGPPHCFDWPALSRAKGTSYFPDQPKSEALEEALRLFSSQGVLY